MAECLLLKSGGAYGSDDCTASKAQVLQGYTAITSDSDDEPVNGTISSKSAATYYATTSDQTIAANQYLSGAQTIKGLTQTNLSGANIKPGVTIKINNGDTDVWSIPSTMSSLGARTYYATKSNQTIAKDQYLTGVQTISKLTQSGLSASNILNGTTVTINNGNANVWSVTGTRKTLTKNLQAWAIKGYGISQDILTDEGSYTVPRAGTVYYHYTMTAYGGSPKAKIELLVNNVAKVSKEFIGNYTYCYELGTDALSVAANDVVKIKCTITQGTHVYCTVGIYVHC